MTENKLSFDYEHFLKECAEQENTLEKLSEDSQEIKNKIDAVRENFKNAFEIFTIDKNVHDKLNLQIAQRQKCVAQIKDPLATLIAEATKLQQDVDDTDEKNDKIGTEIDNEMNALFKKYYNLESMFNEDKLALENENVNKDIEIYKNKTENAMDILSKIEQTSKNKPLQFENCENLNEVTSELVDDSHNKNDDYYVAKINHVSKNLQNLKKSMDELKKQMK